MEDVSFAGLNKRPKTMYSLNVATPGGFDKSFSSFATSRGVRQASSKQSSGIKVD